MSTERFKITATAFDRKGRVISIGHNNYIKSHPFQKIAAVAAGLDPKIFLHAEIDAIIKARGKKIDRLYIERYDKKGKPKLAKPCPVCELAIKKAGVRMVSYTV